MTEYCSKRCMSIVQKYSNSRNWATDMVTQGKKWCGYHNIKCWPKTRDKWPKLLGVLHLYKAFCIFENLIVGVCDQPCFCINLISNVINDAFLLLSQLKLSLTPPIMISVPTMQLRKSTAVSTNDHDKNLESYCRKQTRGYKPTSNNFNISKLKKY